MHTIVNILIIFFAGRHRITGFDTHPNSNFILEVVLGGVLFGIIVFSVSFFMIKFMNHNNSEIFLITKALQEAKSKKKANEKFRQVFHNLEQGVLLYNDDKTMLKNKVLDELINSIEPSYQNEPQNFKFLKVYRDYQESEDG